MFRASRAINIFSDLYYPQTYNYVLSASGARKTNVQVMQIGTDPSSEP